MYLSLLLLFLFCYFHYPVSVSFVQDTYEIETTLEINPNLSPFQINRTVRFDLHKLVDIYNNGTFSADTPLPGVLFNMTAQDGFDTWEVRENRSSLRALVSPSIYAMLRTMPNLNITLIHDNFQEIIDRETFDVIHAKSLKSNTGSEMDWLSSYHNYQETFTWYKKLATNFPHLVEFIPSIGKTYEGRDIFAVKIGSKNETAIFIQSLQHAREWISGSTVNYLTFALLRDAKLYGKQLLDRITFIIVPIANPDGYEYTWTTNRLWRKNRKPFLPYYGTDLNRNWDAYWGKSGFSTFPGSDIFQGPYPASEEETSSIQKFYESQTGIIGAIDMHSYSQYLLWPLSWTTKKYIYEDEHRRIGERMANIIKETSGKIYQAMDSGKMYESSGAAQDYFCGDRVAAVFHYRPYSFIFELRPAHNFGGSGFIVLPSQIIPTGQEIYPAVVEFAEYAMSIRLGP